MADRSLWEARIASDEPCACDRYPYCGCGRLAPDRPRCDCFGLSGTLGHDPACPNARREDDGGLRCAECGQMTYPGKWLLVEVCDRAVAA